MVLPADKAGHEVANREVGMVRRHDPARAERADDLANLDRRQIRVEGDPAALRRIAGQHQIAYEHLALAGRGNVSLDKLEVAVPIAPSGRCASSHWRFFMAYPSTRYEAIFIPRARPKTV